MKNEIADEIRRRIRAGLLVPASNFTETAYLEQGSWHYHAETEPHNHKRDTTLKSWTVEFAYFSKEYRFVYLRGGKFRVVVPKIGVRYPFDCRERHAVIHKDDVLRFWDDAYFRRRFRGGKKEGPLACVFRFV